MKNNNNNAKKIPVVSEQDFNIQFEPILSQYEMLRKQTKQEIYDICKNGTFKQLVYLRAEIVSEMTCNKFYLKKIDDEIQKRLRGDF